MHRTEPALVFRTPELQNHEHLHGNVLVFLEARFRRTVKPEKVEDLLCKFAKNQKFVNVFENVSEIPPAIYGDYMYNSLLKKLYVVIF